MSIQITVLLFVTIALLAASPINANSTGTDYETTNDAYYSGNATTPGSTTVNSMRNGTIYSANTTLYYSTGNYSEKNGTNYFNSTILSTPTGNSSMMNGRIASKKNETLPSYYYNSSTTLQTPAGNFSTINGTFIPKKNQTYTPSYYYTVTRHSSTINGTFGPEKNQTYTPSYYYTLTPHLSKKNGTNYFNSTTLSTPTGNSSFAESATNAQPQSNSSFVQYQVENNKTDDDEYNEKKAIMEERVDSLLERSQFSEFMNNPYDYNNTSNDTKYTTKETNYSGNSTTPASTTIDSEKNGINYFNSTKLSTPTGNSSMINGTIASKKNGTHASYYYNTSTTSQTPAGNFSTINGTFIPKRNQTYTPFYYNTSTTSQTPTGNFSNRVNYWRRRWPSVDISDKQPDYNNSLNNTKDKFKPEITLKHHINVEPQVTTTATPDFSDNQMLDETVNLTQQQYPNKFQVLFDLWLLDSGNGDRMGKFDWNNLSMSEIPEIIYDDYTLIQKKQTILNTFNVLSKFIEQYVSTDRLGSGSLLRFFNGSTTMQDLVMIANVKHFVELDGITDETNSITNSDQKEMGKHGQKVFRKTYTYTEEETVFSNP